MALLKEDNLYTHVIAIDFGTGASGYIFFNLDMLLLQDILTQMENLELKFLTLVMEVMIKKHQQLSYSIVMDHSWILVLMLFNAMLRSFKMVMMLYSSKM